jgi:esterase/lipase
MKYELRFKPSGLNSKFHCECKDLNEYIQRFLEIIPYARVDLTSDNEQTIIEAVRPRLANSATKDHGIILIHGLLDTPSCMQSLYEFFEAQGYHTFSLLLPGHGTRPGDLLNTDIEQWLKSLQFAIKCMHKQVSKLSIVGFSMGASLALYLTQQGIALDNLILFAPAIEITNPLFPIIPSINAIGSYIEKYAWLFQHEDNDYAKYQSIATNAAFQTKRLADKIITNKARIKPPLMVINSSDDETICPKKAMEFFYQQDNPKNRAIYYTNDEVNFDSKTEIVKSAYPKDNILDLSHTAMTNAPNHPHYGKNGDYKDYLHYEGYNKAIECEREVHYGSTNKANLSKFYLERLHYNPFFEEMMQSILSFLD